MTLYLAAPIVMAFGACSSELPSEAGDPPGDAAGAAPVVSRVEPRTLPRAATLDLRIFGSGFDPASRVLLRAREVPGTGVITNSTRYVSSGELTANVTTAADAPSGPYEVVVTSGAGKQGVGTELVDLAPLISGIAPSPAEVGQAVNIAGSGFGLDRSSVRVTFDGHEGSVLSVRDRMVVAAVPVGATIGTVVVELSVTGFSVPASFDLEVTDPIPQISGISPSIVEPGQMVTISGSRFGQGGDEWGATKVSLSVEPGMEIDAPQLFSPSSGPERIVIAVPWELPDGTATLRVVSPYSAVAAEDRLTIVRRSAVPNVEGRYILGNDIVTTVIQDDATVTVEGITGTLFPDGRWRGEGGEVTGSGCERFTVALTFAVTGYSGFSECEQLGGFVERVQWDSERLGPAG